jgi:crotonobetainyl-CoA:carnitine CoA-transferase CaiB-like acyl-CoA transferase
MCNGHPNIVPYQDFPTADGDMILAIGNDGQFARFCQIAGRPEWSTDERFATNSARVRNRTELLPLLRQTTVMKTTAEWIALLEKSAVPCGPINDLAGVFDDPQVKHRGLRVEMPHAAGGMAPQVGNPMQFSLTPIDYRRAPPVLGQDTESVLRELGRSDEAIAALRAAGVI